MSWRTLTMALHDDAETQLLLSVQNGTENGDDPNAQLPTRRTPHQPSYYPFAAQLIRDVRTTHGDVTKVEYYVGTTVGVYTALIASQALTPSDSTRQAIFYSTQAMTVLHWSRLPDRIGQKPVIPFGLIGLSRSVYCFGLSQTFWGLVVSRSINGAMNENIGEMKQFGAKSQLRIAQHR
ncbi:hypothetical protein B0H14DRAFT_3883813 [Mycena olivaceomarginata]|nr:hypothetical protein B0H14DRAFT_3883813 [Mycena olivaceomarginata]